MRADSLLLPMNVKDDFDRELVERKLQKVEQKLQELGKGHPEFSLLQKKMDRYRNTLKDENVVNADVTLQDALDALTAKSSSHSGTQTPTAFVPLSSPRSNKTSSTKGSRNKTPKKNRQIRVNKQTDAHEYPMSPAQDSLIHSCCSPTELGESYISIDPFSPQVTATSKRQTLPPPPLAQAETVGSEQQLFCKVFQQQQQQDGEIQVGFIMLENGPRSTFADARRVIVEELVGDMLSTEMQWKFVVPSLGRVSKKQEAIFGPLMNMPGDATLGSLQNPLSLVIVKIDASAESGAADAASKPSPPKQRMESAVTVVTGNVGRHVAQDDMERDQEQPSLEQCSGQQSNQAMEKVEEKDEESHVLFSTEIPDVVPNTSTQDENKVDDSDDDSTSSSEAPTMKRSWTIQKKPPVPPPPAPTKVEEEEEHTASSCRRRELLIGYNRPEEFDPQPRSKHSRSVPSPRQLSPRKPRGSRVSEAVSRFQSSQTERNESALSTADSIDSTKPFVVMIDPKRSDQKGTRVIDDVDHALQDTEHDKVEETSACAIASEVPTTQEETVVSRLQGFGRRFWKPKGEVSVAATHEPEATEDDKDEEALVIDLDDDDSDDGTDNATAQTDTASEVEIIRNVETKPGSEMSVTAVSVGQDTEEFVDPIVMEDDRQCPEQVKELPQTQAESDDEIMEVTAVQPRITKRLVMLVTLYSGNREIMPKQKRAISMLETCKVVPRILDGSDPSNKDTRNELFEIAGMRGVYPLFFVEERNEADPRSKPNVTFFGTFEAIEKRRENGTLGDVLKV
jgi:hypothetical protein